jgi:hypothetical protein
MLNLSTICNINNGNISLIIQQFIITHLRKHSCTWERKYLNCVVCDKLLFHERFILTRLSFYVIKFSYELLLVSVHFEKTVSHLFSKIAGPYETAIFTEFSHMSPSWDRIFQRILPQPTYLESLVIICIPQFIFSKCFLAFQFPTKISNAFLSFPVRLVRFK